MINTKKEIKTLRGEFVPMSFPTPMELEKVQAKTGKLDVLSTDLPPETVGNVIINCLAVYAVENQKEVFDVQLCANWVLDESEDKKELSERLRDFLAKKVLPQCTLRNEKEGEKTVERGIYSSWVIVQVLAELGVTE